MEIKKKLYWGLFIIAIIGLILSLGIFSYSIDTKNIMLTYLSIFSGIISGSIFGELIEKLKKWKK